MNDLERGAEFWIFIPERVKAVRTLGQNGFDVILFEAFD